MITLDDSQPLSAKTDKVLNSHQDDLNSNPSLKKFIDTSKDDTIEGITSCNEILDHKQNQDDKDQIEWCFKRVAYHERQLPQNRHNYDVSLYNAMIEWKNGKTSETL